MYIQMQQPGQVYLMNLNSARDELVEPGRRPGIRLMPLALETVCVFGVSYLLVGWFV